jgi:Zn-dependent protease
MNTDLQETIFRLILAIPAFVIALTIHEFAHAWMATRQGDDLAKRQGRLTLDPMAHLDPFGSLMFLISSLVGFGIGWAKPVPFDPRNLKNPRRDSMLIAVAGPVSNLLQVPFWMAGLWVLSAFMQPQDRFFPYAVLSFFFGQPLGEMSLPVVMGIVMANGILINVMLAAFNMLPFPPLDGHYILEGLSPPFIADFFESIRPYGFMILIAMSYLGLLSVFLAPFQVFAFRLLSMAVR